MIDAAALVLVEAGPEEEAALKAAMARDPSLMFTTTGPTLPERMAESDWQRLSGAMSDRGIPPFLAAKFRPWYAAMMLAMSPCAIGAATNGEEGLDAAVRDRAQAPACRCVRSNPSTPPCGFSPRSPKRRRST